MGDFALVAIGSNMGEREAHLGTGRGHLRGAPGVAFVDASTIEETKPVGNVKQDPFLNQMVLLDTERTPQELLELCHEAEHAAGRTRGEHWGPRTLDLDVVWFADREIDGEGLRIPHPAIADRPFWIREMAELLPLVFEAEGFGFPEWARMSQQRKEHARRVVGLLGAWAIAMGRRVETRSRWLRAAYRHDALKDASDDEILELVGKDHGPKPVLHGPAAAARTRADGETDEGVLNAIAYHSVGYADWDSTGRMLYLADYLEPGRPFKKKKRRDWAAEVPHKPKKMLRRVARARLRALVDDACAFTPEGVEFWNAVARRC